MSKATIADPFNRMHDAKLNPWNVLGAPVLPPPPSPDDLMVGVDGSTPDNPLPRGSIHDPTTRTVGGYVVRADIATPCSIGPYRLTPGLHFLGCVYGEEMEPVLNVHGKRKGGLHHMVTRPEQIALLEEAKAIWTQEARAWLFDKNLGDPSVDAFPQMDRFTLKDGGPSVWGILHRLGNERAIGGVKDKRGVHAAIEFGPIYSYKIIRENPVPLNAITATSSAAAATQSTIDIMRASLEAQLEANRLNAALLAEMRAGKEPKEKRT